ncbi:MAG: glycosyltransferase family 2 protein [bacterium]|nr:glycosyltransferase family 2 protein [bacterium]
MDTTSCSIVVCTYNRLGYLKKCIPALLDINFSQYEIVVVDDGSSDNTVDFLNSLSNEKIRVIRHAYNKGLSEARNTGIANARYDIIAFTDDDCVVTKDWLTALVGGFENENIGLVIGQTFYVSKDYRGYFPERLVSNKDAKWPMGCNVAYQKKVFDVCGGFDGDFFDYNNEDSEMAIRAVSKGFSFKRVPNAIVSHQAMDWTVKSLLRSAVNASVWPVLKKKYPHHYQVFGPPVKYGVIVNPKDYIYILTALIFIPLLFIRYLMHGKRDIKIFFTKWPVYVVLRRYYVYKEAIRQRLFML